MRVLTNAEYEAVLNLFHVMDAEFWRLSEEVKNAFFDRLYENVPFHPISKSES